MWRVPVGWKDQLATLKHVFPQFPTDTRHIWQRPNAGHVKNNRNFKSNRNFNHCNHVVACFKRIFNGCLELGFICWDFLFFAAKQQLIAKRFKAFYAAMFGFRKQVHSLLYG